MGALIPTTRITVLRGTTTAAEDPDSDGYVEEADRIHGSTQASDLAAVRTGVLATISGPTGSRAFGASGGEATVSATLVADPCGLQQGDVIQDESTGDRYSMQWFHNYDQPGHLIKSSQAGLTRTTVI